MNNENEKRDAASVLIEEAISLANEAGVLCSACVGKIETGPMDFCSTCQKVVRLWLTSMVERECVRIAAEQPGRLTITREGETTFVTRNW
jgi:hypothetical protein